MRTITAQLDAAFRSAITAAFGFDADPFIVPSANDKFGDYQANAAMGLAKEITARTGQKTNPRAVAEQIITKLDLGPIASEISIAGPGFINVRLSPQWLAAQLKEAGQSPHMGIEPAATPQTVVVDYSGPNVAKEMHVGHLRSTIIGDAISRVVELQGHTVIRQNHIGDWGTQFGMLIAHLKESGQEALSQIKDLESFYRSAKTRFDSDPAFADEARRTVVRLQGGQPEELALWQRIVEATRQHNQPIYNQLRVKLSSENERGESFYNPMLSSVVADLKAKGIAVDSEGAVVCFVEGWENPLIVEKSGGGYLYGTTDLAAIRYRTEQLHATRIIYVTGAPQTQHFAQVFAVANKAGWAPGVSLEHAAFGSVLGEDGKMFKTRSGGTVKLAELLDEAETRGLAVVQQKAAERDAQFSEPELRSIARAVGIGAVKYADLSKDRNSDYVFSWDKMLAMDGNTAPYLQYAYARIKSIFRRAAERGITMTPNTDIRLESPFELALAKHILRLQEIVDLISRELKPHYLSSYLYELATRFSGFFENCPVLQSDEPLRSSRLALCDLTARTMAVGLNLLGIEHPEQM